MAFFDALLAFIRSVEEVRILGGMGFCLMKKTPTVLPIFSG